MKVLWFTNTPSLGAQYLNTTVLGGGWIESLEEWLTKTTNLELGVVFKWNEALLSPFAIEKTKYYPIFNPEPGGRFKRILRRWQHKIENGENNQKYLSIIQEFKPDLIHIFGTENDFGLIIPETSIPCIIHIQGNLTVYDHKWFSGLSLLDVFRYSGKLKLLKGLGLLHEYVRYGKEAEREQEIFRGCHFFMGRTDWDRRIALSLSPGSKYFHCEEMLRKEFYAHQWDPGSFNEKGSYTILTTIRKNIYKGLETVLECKKILQKNVPGLKVQWRIAGITHEDEVAYLTEKIYKEKFADYNIQLLGPLPVDQLIEEMLKADLFIHPSHIDNSPNSVCEAMILGMPIIATYAGGIPSLLADKKEGLLVQDGDPYALCGAIIELNNDKQFATSLGSNARMRALSRNNDEKIVNSVMRVYDHVIDATARISTGKSYTQN